MDAVIAGNDGFYFFSMYGKTSLLSFYRINIASSGIAATLLQGDNTTHLALKLPLNVHIMEAPTCNISKISEMGKILQQYNIIKWGKFMMMHKKSLGALNRTL